jgi:hypothetical protein
LQQQKSLTQADLDQFTGSEHWYRHALVPSLLFTDGAKHVADAAGAYWLLDEIALAQRHQKAVAAEEFQVWILKVSADHTSPVKMAMTTSSSPSRSNSPSPIFPLPEITAVVREQHDLPAERTLRRRTSWRAGIHRDQWKADPVTRSAAAPRRAT